MKNFLGLSTLLCLFIVKINAQTLNQDLKFATNGTINLNKKFGKTLLLDDNKLLVPYGDQLKDYLTVAKYNPDGSLDQTFGINGLAIYNSPNYYSPYIEDAFRPKAITVQADDKIVVCGEMLYYKNRSYYNDFFLIRFNSNGTLDLSFGSGGLIRQSINDDTEYFSDIALDSYGRIIAVGQTTSNNNTNQYTESVAMRFLNNGELDTTFATNGILKLNLTGWDYFNQIKILINGSILIAGAFEVTTNNLDVMLLKLTQNGQFDTSFGNNGRVNLGFNTSGYCRPLNIITKPDDKLILIGSHRSNYNGNGSEIFFSKFLSNGILDTSFSDDGINIVSVSVPKHHTVTPTNIIQLPNNKLFIIGYSRRSDMTNGDLDFSITKFNEDSSLDKSFCNNGSYVNTNSNLLGYSSGIHRHSDGKLIIVIETWCCNRLGLGNIYRFTDNNLLGIDENDVTKNNLTVFPNPSKNKFEILINDNIQKVEIFNLIGQKIKTIISNFNDIDATDLEKGTYLLKIYVDNKKIKYSKIIKE